MGAKENQKGITLSQTNLKMKTFAVATLVATVAAADKKVPPRHPLQRLSKLGRFERCGHYDESQEHGGQAGAERKRRDAEDACLDIDSELCRYDKSNPIRGIKQTTSGFRKWAERYLANDKDGASCKLQPAKQVARAQAWHDKLLAKLAVNL